MGRLCPRPLVRKSTHGGTSEFRGGAYLPDCIQMYGGPPTCLFQQDGSSPRTSHATQDYSASQPRKFRREEEWPPNAPSLNAIDFFARMYLQTQFGEKPKCVDTLDVAIRKAGDEMPLMAARRALDSSPLMDAMCIQKAGGRPKDACVTA